MSDRERELSVFVDESGSFDSSFVPSRFYIISCVFHDQRFDLSQLLATLDSRLAYFGNPDLCIHAGPIIRREDEFANLPLSSRRKLLGSIVSFASHAPIHYHAVCVDKRFCTSTESIIKSLTRQLTDYLAASRAWLANYTHIKIYYDNGQATVRTILKDAFEGLPVHFPPHVTPERYRLFQVADLACTVELLKAKLKAEDSLTKSEELFFRNAGVLRRNYIRPLSRLMR